MKVPLAGCGKVHRRYWKVEAEAKAEMRKVRFSLTLDLDLILPSSLRLDRG
jgi:hypothetical protein